MPDVVALGDTNIDIIAHFPSYPAEGQDALAESAEFHCGGSAANSAMALARMGLEVALISRLGVDPLASKALDSLREAGVSLACLQRDPTASTGLMVVIVTPGGERTILGHRGANVLTDPGQIHESDICGARLLHLSGYAFLADPQHKAALLALEIAHRHNLKVTLDPGMSVPLAPLHEIRALLPAVDVLLPNLFEAQYLAGKTAPEDCVQALLGTGVRVVALKLGQDGCLIGCGDYVRHVPGFTVQVQDTTGAGDFFAAGIIAGFLHGLDWLGAAVLGNAMGAMATARMGAGTSVPRAGEVLALLNDHRLSAKYRACVEGIERAIDLIMMLAAKPEEEGKLWWK